MMDQWLRDKDSAEEIRKKKKTKRRNSGNEITDVDRREMNKRKRGEMREKRSGREGSETGR